MRWLFPEVPDGHPAQGAMLMNFAANMLGLDNAATPMGLKAMEELANAQSRKGHGHEFDGSVPGDQLRQRHAHSVYDHRLPLRERQQRPVRNHPRNVDCLDGKRRGGYHRRSLVIAIAEISSCSKRHCPIIRIPAGEGEAAS